MTAYVGCYFAVGAVVYCLFYVFVATKRVRENTDLGAEFVAGVTGNKHLLDKILNGLLAPLIAVVIFLAIWPWLVWMAARDALAGKNNGAEKGRGEFEVCDEFLVCELPLREIECWEMVEDPLGAAPRLPFGHLNPAWEEFKVRRDENGAFWKFSGKHVDDWDTEWLREGYAILNGNGTRPYFLSRLEYLGRTTGSDEV